MAISKTPIDAGLEFFSKILVHTPVTKTTSNLYGDRILTEGSAVNIKGVFYRRSDVLNPDKPGLFDGADAILLVKTGITINMNDKITYDGENYRVSKPPVTRALGTTKIYKKCDLHKI